MDTPRKAYWEQVTQKLVKHLQQGTAPWQKAVPAGETQNMPMSPVTGNRFKGINAINLLMQGHSDPRWMTYDEAEKLGGQVRKGEKATFIQYWKFTEERDKRDVSGRPVLDENGEKIKERVRLENPKYLNSFVFNASQIDGLPALEKKELSLDPVDRACSLLAASKARLHHSYEIRSTHYNHSRDEIFLPYPEIFDSSEKYCSSALNQMMRWAGHSSRLDRNGNHPAGTTEYAREELRTQIASMFLGDELGIGHDSNSKRHVGKWVKLLEDEPFEIFRAASDAEKMLKFVMAFDSQVVQQENSLLNFVRSAEQDREQIRSSNEQPRWKVERRETPIKTVTLVETDSASEALEFFRSADQTTVTDMSTGKNVAFTRFVSNTRQEWLPSASFLAYVEAEEKGFNAVVDSGSNYDDADARAVAAEESMPARFPRPRPGLSPADHELAEAIFLAEINPSLFPERNKLATKAFGRGVAPLPNDWTGEARFKPTILETSEDNPDGFERDAKPGEVPDGHLVEVRSRNGSWGYFYSGMQAGEASEFVSRLTAIGDQAGLRSVQDLERASVSDDQLEREQWVIERVVTPGEHLGTLPDVINRMSQKQCEIVEDILISMHPLNNSNAFWLRHSEALDKMLSGPDVVEERVILGLNATEARWNHLDGGQDISAKPIVGAVIEDALDKVNASIIAKEKTWLAIPFEEREAAKAAAGRFKTGEPAITYDNVEKCWYAKPGTDLNKVKEWLPENRPAPTSSMDWMEEFASTMREFGLVVPDGGPIADGKMHRVAVEGSKSSRSSGSYKLYQVEPGEKGVPAGFIENHRTGVKTTWKAKGYVLSDGDKAKISADAAKRIAERDRVRELAQARSTKAVRELLAVAPAASADHTYLTKKLARPGDLKAVPKDASRLPPDSPILIGANAAESKALRLDNPDKLVFTAGDLLLTAQNIKGDVQSVQSIRSNGSKMFAKDGLKSEGFHVVGGAGLESIKNEPLIVICEGYATADSISQSLGFPIIAAFDSGNLPLVAKAFNDMYPDKAILIAGDNDVHQTLVDGTNAGRTKALEAAKLVGGEAVFAVFAPGEQSYPTNLEPIDQEKAKKNQLSPEQNEALTKMKKFTDFNDLVTQSVLGRDGLDRQIRAAAALALKNNQSRAASKTIAHRPTIKDSIDPPSKKIKM